MSYGHFVRRMFRLGAFGAAVLSWPASATGEPDRSLDRRACVSAYKSAVDLEQAAHFRQAQELVLTCMNEVCGPGVRQKCAALAMRMQADLPSVVPIVTDAAGAPRVDVLVRVDGELLASQLNGMSFPIDPGLHEFSFSADNRVFATKKILIVQGERNRAITVMIQSSEKKAKMIAPLTGAPLEPKTLGEKMTPAKAVIRLDGDKPWAAKTAPAEAEPAPAAAPAPASPEKTPFWKKIAWKPLLPYGLAGVGVLGVGASALLASSDGKETAANVSLGIGVAALAGAFTSWFWFRESDSSKGGAHSAVVVDVHPARDGAFATMSGSF